MICDKGIEMKFVLLLLLGVFVWGDEGARCIEREREALVSFKNGLIDGFGILSSWRSDECCNWYGVVCSNTTDGHVIRLELGVLDFDGVLRGKLSSSLLELHHLNYLDLSYNDFGGHPIPEFIGSMKQLGYLDLRACNFFGMVPPELGNLTNLRTLALSSNSLTSDNLNWLSSLSLLSYLRLGGNDFGGHSIPEFIGSMKKLEQLYLWGCNFSGVIPPQLGNLTNLLTLDLSDNSLKSENLDWLSNLSSLSVLDLSDSLDLSDTNWLHQIPNLHSLQELHLRSCNISDVNPPVVNSSSTSLSFLDLSDNHLTSSVFDWLFNVSLNVVRIDLSENALGGLIPNKFERLTHLEYIDLSSNMLEGEILTYFFNLSHLQALVVYDNQLRGRLDEFIGNLSAKAFLSSLQILDLAKNKFDGPIPDLSMFSALTQVYLGHNNLTGSLPLSFGQLSNLHILEVSSNHLEGVVSESHFTKLDKLRILDLSLNSLSLDVAQDWNPPFQLKALYLAGCNMGPSFPKWIQNQKNLTYLDLSSVGIIDEVPMWLWSLSPSFVFLFLSDNQISGTIPDLSSISIKYIDLSSNKISGSIPLFHPNTVSFQLSRNMFSGSISSSICKFPHDELIFLDLSNNQLSGELPNCFKKMPNLKYLNLANNSFSGKMPHSLPDYLETLRLSHNNLSGELPSTLRFCQELRLIDVGGNKLNGEIPSWIGAIYHMRFLNLRSNEFYGGIPPEICNLTHIRVLDISRNNLSGRIPNCFNNLATLAEKDATNADNKFGGFHLYHYYDPQLSDSNIIKVYNEYSSFQWKGQELEYRKNLFFVTLIDISSNRLSGTIPQSFSNLRGLISLNLSRNSLTGNIIPNIGQMEMLECLDLSHNQLSGEIPMSLAQLHFLDVLDLSDNNLCGKIPSSTQLQTFNMSSYDGNDGLCGSPLALCPEDSSRSPTPTQGEEDDGLIWSPSFMQGLCISIGFGFIVGFWGAVGSLVLKKSWRYAYFNLLDDVGDWFYVRILIFLSKWRRS